MKQIGLPLHGRPILLSHVWLQTELDSTQSYYHDKLLRFTPDYISLAFNIKEPRLQGHAEHN